MKRLRPFVLVLFAAGVWAVLSFSEEPATTPFHSRAELDAFQRAPIDTGEYFLGSIRCKGCHGYDSAQFANLDESGNDINLYDDWESSMMALSAKDPFWRAKVSSEILHYPNHSDEIQTKCTSCHAPMGHYSAMFKGHGIYTVADMLLDTLGLNGVACGACHEIAHDSLGLQYSGHINYDTSRVEYGPFENPDIGPMQLYVGLLPTHSDHVSRSQVCASCHTLITMPFDYNGNPSGSFFIEQATYHEWLNSSYNSTQPCQSCHMPQIQDPVVIANGYINLPPRSPFNLHKFMGANATMLKLMKQNKGVLGIDVADAHFDSTITNTIDLMWQNTLDYTMNIDSLTADTLFVAVKLKNKAGHKFPSGYPSRRAFVSMVVTSGNDTLFQSGILDRYYEIEGNTLYEPHYEVIDRSNQTQTYEMVMTDLLNNFTTVLSRAGKTVKDNRIPPAGFITSHPVYDTVKIVGNAAQDSNFNYNNNQEGSGSDIVYYHIPVHADTGSIHIASAVYYQTIPARWMFELTSHSSDFIDSMQAMYNRADLSPVLVAAADVDTMLLSVGIDEKYLSETIKVYPTLSADGKVRIVNESRIPIDGYRIYNVSGELVGESRRSFISGVIQLPNATGTYLIQFKAGEYRVVKKVVKM